MEGETSSRDLRCNRRTPKAAHRTRRRHRSSVPRNGPAPGRQQRGTARDPQRPAACSRSHLRCTRLGEQLQRVELTAPIGAGRGGRLANGLPLQRAALFFYWAFRSGLNNAEEVTVTDFSAGTRPALRPRSALRDSRRDPPPSLGIPRAAAQDGCPDRPAASPPGRQAPTGSRRARPAAERPRQPVERSGAGRGGADRPSAPAHRLPEPPRGTLRAARCRREALPSGCVCVCVRKSGPERRLEAVEAATGSGCPGCQGSALHCSPLLCITLYCSPLPCTALHYPPLPREKHRRCAARFQCQHFSSAQRSPRETHRWLSSSSR